MLRVCLFLFFFSHIISLNAQHFKPVDQGSKIHFNIKNFGINTGGDLSALKGNIDFAPSNIKACNFHVSVEAKTIDTDNKTRDEHLKSTSYFDAEKYPLVTLQSTRITLATRAKGGGYIFSGTLTMHGITRVIEFPFTATLQGQDYVFKGSFEINRQDFNIGGRSGVLGNTVKVSLSVTAKKI